MKNIVLELIIVCLIGSLGLAGCMSKSKKAEKLLYEATFFRDGIGRAKDSREAFRLFKESAQMGNDFAKYQVGLCYLNGEGVIQDYAEAVRWFTPLAENGGPNSQLELARCYAQGKGVQKNIDVGIRWAKLSAEQGNVDAQFLLSSLYALIATDHYDDYRTPTFFDNFKEAYFWHLIAKASGGETTADRDRMEYYFEYTFYDDTKQEIKIRAQQWLEQHNKK